MADNISTRTVLAPFQTAAALNELTDYFLLQANRTAQGGDGSQSAIRLPAALVKAYLMSGFEITVNDDGYIVIGGTTTDTKVITDRGTPVVNQIDTLLSVGPDVLNVWGEVASITITSLAPGTTGYAHEYMLQFAVAVNATNFSLALPGSVRWVDGDEPDFEPGNTYQVSIENNMAVAAGWPTPEDSGGGAGSSGGSIGPYPGNSEIEQ